MKRLLTPFILVFAILAAGCEYPVKPQGDAGVISFPLTFRFADARFDGNVASVQFDAPEITRGVVEHGAVLVYFRDQGTWTAMPFTIGVEALHVEAVDFTISIGYAFERRLVETFVEISTEDVWDDALDLLPSRYDLKVVVINDRPFGKNAPDFSDYEAVRAFYGLTD